MLKNVSFSHCLLEVSLFIGGIVIFFGGKGGGGGNGNGKVWWGMEEDVKYECVKLN